MTKKALITGITGQDAAYLSRFLLEKGYKVYGAHRRSSTLNFWRLEELGIKNRVELVSMELTDLANIIHVIRRIQPDEIYNLGAQSVVQVSFEEPIHTGDVNGLAVARLLDAVRLFSPHSRFYQASTSELFGCAQTPSLSETSPFRPCNPYAVGKLYGHWTAVDYRENYNVFTCCGIMFNHESPLRGPEFVSRKITSGMAAVKLGLQDYIELGHMDSRRDWGFAGDYVDAMWRMLQQDAGDVYVLATGRMTSVREFVEIAASSLDIDLVWEGEGTGEVGRDRISGKIWIKINPQFYRPVETKLAIADPSKVMSKLGWKPKVSLDQMVEMMVEADIRRLGGEVRPLQLIRA
jgi:GDPmannose 4,6-dehydratase